MSTKNNTKLPTVVIQGEGTLKCAQSLNNIFHTFHTQFSSYTFPKKEICKIRHEFQVDQNGIHVSFSFNQEFLLVF